MHYFSSAFFLRVFFFLHYKLSLVSGMISLMSSNLDSPSDPKVNEVEAEECGVSSNLDCRNDSAGGLNLPAVCSRDELTRVSIADSNKSSETGVSDRNETMFSELKMEGEAGVGLASVEPVENQPSFSASEMPTNSKRTDVRDCKSESKKGRSAVEVYDSMLSAFDEFAAKDNGEAVGYGYEVGDMVWGKVKSHPWWPGQIFNENYASVSVRKSKREGHVLVAFFGDSSYGWFLPAELIPFESNFVEKSRQTNLRTFLVAVEEAVDELSRRRSLGLSCRCRNEYNFWPSGLDGYFVVHMGDEPGVYSSSQINKARDGFQPRKMLFFMQQLALKPTNIQHLTVDLIKNKATILACRKALFEEFDETYAQAFGSTAARPPRPTAPVALDPSKAPLSGRLVVAEALGKRDISVKPTKVKDQVEKDKYLLKRRDEPTPKKPRKASISSHPILGDGSGISEKIIHSGMGENMNQNYESRFTDGQDQLYRHSLSMVSDSKPSEGSGKLVNSATKNVKLHKRPLHVSSEHAILDEKKKKKIKKETSTTAGVDIVQLPAAFSNSGVTAEKVSGIPALHVRTTDNNCQLDNQKKDSVLLSTSSKVEAQVDSGNIKLSMLLKDLCALALNPFHGMDKSCAGNALPVFLKFRSLVYQKSLVLAPTESDEASEVRSSMSLPAAHAFAVSVEATNGMTMSSVKSSVRPGNSSKSVIKRGPLDRPEGIKKKIKSGDSEVLKKKRFDLEDVKKMKVTDSEIIKKKKMFDALEDKIKMKKINESETFKKVKMTDDGKLSAAEKKPFQRSAESQRVEGKEIVGKHVPLMLGKAGKKDSSKKMEEPGRIPNPTMLVMKFPSGAGLPSGAELRARFARFGPMDHSATRVFWKSYTCRIVYQYKSDAEAALKFVNGSSNLFGSTNVRCHLRDLLAEAAEIESAKIQKEDPLSVGTLQSRDPSVEQRTATAQLTQQSGQLRSCLKKPTSEEVGNGGGRGSRVKFVFHGEESSKNEQLLSGNTNTNNIACFPEVASSSTYSLDINSKNLSKFIVPAPPTPLQKFPISLTSSTEKASARLYPPDTRAPLNNDISQEMLNLLNKCSDVVDNLTRVLGYLPYRAL